jgi:hypothetical protein
MHGILVEEPLGKCPLEDQEDGRITLGWPLESKVVWIGDTGNWIRLVSMASFGTGDELPGSTTTV